MNAPPKRPPCWACGDTKRSGPRNQPCHCQEPKDPKLSLSQQSYTCPSCYSSWSRALGTHICPSCGYDRENYKMPKFSRAHREIRGIVQSNGGSMPPETKPPPTTTDDGWMEGFI